ncbi:MAG TPA: hypothetical protein ENO30_00700 [Thermodesulfobium narugense]|nr:hypothetical protein [Thermodesulfobium narugense]
MEVSNDVLEISKEALKASGVPKDFIIDIFKRRIPYARFAAENGTFEFGYDASFSPFEDISPLWRILLCHVRNPQSPLVISIDGEEINVREYNINKPKIKLPRVVNIALQTIDIPPYWIKWIRDSRIEYMVLKIPADASRDDYYVSMEKSEDKEAFYLSFHIDKELNQRVWLYDIALNLYKDRPDKFYFKIWGDEWNEQQEKT